MRRTKQWTKAWGQISTSALCSSTTIECEDDGVKRIAASTSGEPNASRSPRAPRAPRMASFSLDGEPEPLSLDAPSCPLCVGQVSDVVTDIAVSKTLQIGFHHGT